MTLRIGNSMRLGSLGRNVVLSFVLVSVLGLVGIGHALAAPSPTDPNAAIYEAEGQATVYTGNAKPKGCGDCSGGGAVGDTYDNSSFTVKGIRAPQTGTYPVEISYISGDPRSAMIRANGGSPQQVNFPSTGSWSTLGKFKISLALNAGNNTITVSSGSGASPDFDAFFISGALPPLPGPVTVEAESASRNGDIAIVGCTACSMSAKITGIDRGESVTFERIQVQNSGTFEVELHYVAAGPRGASVSANGGSARTIALPATGSAIGQVTIPLALVAGLNTITVAGASQSAFDIDRIVVPEATVVIGEFPIDPNAADPIPRDTKPNPGPGRNVTFGDGDVKVSYDLGRGTADVTWKHQKGNEIVGFYSGVRLDTFVTTQHYKGACTHSRNVVTCQKRGMPTLKQHFDGTSPCHQQPCERLRWVTLLKSNVHAKLLSNLWPPGGSKMPPGTFYGKRSGRN